MTQPMNGQERLRLVRGLLLARQAHARREYHVGSVDRLDRISPARQRVETLTLATEATARPSRFSVEQLKLLQDAGALVRMSLALSALAWSMYVNDIKKVVEAARKTNKEAAIRAWLRRRV